MILIHLHCIDSSVDCSYSSNPPAPPAHTEANETDRHVMTDTTPTGSGSSKADETDQSKANQSNRKVIIPIVISLAVTVLVLALIAVLYMLYRRHGKKSSGGHIRLVEVCSDDHHGNTIIDHGNTISNEPTIQAAQEAGGSGVFTRQELTTPTEPSQSHQPTLQELINRKYARLVPTAATECSKERSSLVGCHEYNINLTDTVA